MTRRKQSVERKPVVTVVDRSEYERTYIDKRYEVGRGSGWDQILEGNSAVNKAHKLGALAAIELAVYTQDFSEGAVANLFRNLAAIEPPLSAVETRDFMAGACVPTGHEMQSGSR